MQEYIVAAIVIGAVWVVVRRYAPPALKSFCADLTLRTAKRLGWSGLARRIETKKAAAMDCASDCSTCGGCGPVVKKPAGEFVVKFDNLKRKN